METTAKVYSIAPSPSQLALSYMAKNNITKTRFAELIEYHRTNVSQYFSGKYTGDIEKLEQKIISFLKSVDFIKEGEVNTTVTRKNKFSVTNDSMSVLAVCQGCQDYASLGVVIGKSGFGKTCTLKNYAKSNNRVCYIECDDSMSTRDLVKAIEKGLGLPSTYGSTWERVSAIKEFFHVCSGYLIIIDEADKLISKYTQKKIEILRSIFDESKDEYENHYFGLILAGEPSLDSKMISFIDRLAKRVDFKTKLNGVTRKEVEEYLQGYNFTAEALREMVMRATNTQTGCFRLLDRTLKNVLRLVEPEDEITIDIIKKASQMMML